MTKCETTFGELQEAGVSREAIDDIALTASRLKKTAEDLAAGKRAESTTFDRAEQKYMDDKYNKMYEANEKDRVPAKMRFRVYRTTKGGEDYILVNKIAELADGSYKVDYETATNNIRRQMVVPADGKLKDSQYDVQNLKDALAKYNGVDDVLYMISQTGEGKVKVDDGRDRSNSEGLVSKFSDGVQIGEDAKVTRTRELTNVDKARALTKLRKDKRFRGEESYRKALIGAIMDIKKPTVTVDDMLAFSTTTIEGLIEGKLSYTPAATMYTSNKVVMAGTSKLDAQAENLVVEWYLQDTEEGRRVAATNSETEVVKMMAASKAYKDFAERNQALLLADMVKTIADAGGAHTLAHEMIHIGAKVFMDANPNSPLTKKIEDLYQEALDNGAIITKMSGTSYWTSSIDEFIAEGLTNPNLVRTLNHFRTKHGATKFTKMFKPFIDSLLSMLGITKNDSMYQHLLDGFTAMLETQKKLGSESNVSDDGYTLSESMKAHTMDGLLDIADKLYNEDFDAGKVDEAHASYLYDMMYNYEKAINKIAEELDITVDIMAELVASDANIRGSAIPEVGKVKLMMGSRKYQSGLEILAHEMQHVLIEQTLERSPDTKFGIRKLRELMAKSLDKSVFMDGIENPTQEDMNRAEAMFEYVFHNSANPESEFLAYATTNAQVMKAIGGLKVTGELLPISDGSGRVARVYNWIAGRINKVYSSIKYGKGANGRDVAMVILKQALEIAADDKKKTDDGVLNTIGAWLSKADSKVRSYTEKTEIAEKSLADQLREGLDSKTKVQRVIEKMWKIRGLSSVRSYVLQNNLFNSLTRSSDNEDIGKFYDMFRQSKMLIDRTVQGIKNVTYDTLLKNYDFEQMDKGVRRATKRALLDADYRAIGDLDDFVRVASSDEEWMIELAKAEAGLKPETIAAAEALGVMVASNQANTHNGFTNATQVARVVEKVTHPEVISRIDKIASLYALKAVGTTDTELAVKAIKENKRGVEAAMNMYYAHQEELVKVAYGGDRWQLDKSSKQDHYEDRRKYYLVSEEEMKELTRRTKMVNIGKHDELSRLVGKSMYTVVGDGIDSQYSEGLMSMVQLKSEGDSLRRILKESGMTDDEVVVAIANEARNQVKGYGEFLVPDRGFDGTIMDYRFRISQDVKEKYLGLDNDIVHTVSHTVANLTHKDEAIMSNKRAIEHLAKFYETYKNDDTMKFVKIDKDSEGKLKEYWDRMPGYLKRELKRLTGSQELMIEESLMVDFFGYKDASLANLTRSKRWQLALRKVEGVTKEIAQVWKKNIVTKSSATIGGNLSSNMLVTLQHTNNKNPIEYAKEFERVWEYLNQYQKDFRDLNRLKVLKSAGETIADSRIESLKSAMKDNPVNVLMEDGQYSAILEDIDLGLYDNKGLVANKIKDALGKIKKEDRRNAVKTVFDTLYLTNDSKVYQKLLKLTQYGDMINRVIIHEDNMKYDKMTERQSLRYVDGLFVNYAYLDNKYVKYMNDLGFVTFTKFFFRTMPALLKMAALKPVTMFMTESTKSVTGLDWEHPIDQVYHPIDTMSRKLMLWDEPGNVAETILTPSLLHGL